MTHVPTNGGLVNPAAEIGAVAREAGVPYLLDACQSVGQMPVDVQAIGCDMLSTTGRKYLRGPRGTGFLYVRREVIPRAGATDARPARRDLDRARQLHDPRRCPPLRELGDELRRQGRPRHRPRLRHRLGTGRHLRARAARWPPRLRAALAEIPGVRVHDRRRAQLRHRHASRSRASTPAGAAARWRPRRSTSSSPARPRRQLDMEARGLARSVRASVHYYNTEEEIDRFCGLVSEVAPRLRRSSRL